MQATPEIQKKQKAQKEIKRTIQIFKKSFSKVKCL